MATNLFRCGSFATTDPSQIILLRGAIQTSGRVSTLRLNTATSGYAVTTGKRLYIVRAKVSTIGITAAGTNPGVSIGYADNDVGLDVTTARTNPVPVFGDPEQTTAVLAGGITYQENAVHGNAASFETQMNTLSNVIIPATVAGKYTYAKAFFNQPVDVQLWCVELDA